MEAAISIAKRILGFDDDKGSPFEMLSLAPAVDPVTPVSSIDQCRANYRRLAAMIHPDRLRKSGFEHSTEAFQKLVRVFEAASDPVLRLKFMNKKSFAREEKEKNKISKPKAKEDTTRELKQKKTKDSSLSSSSTKVPKKPRSKSFIINDGNKSDVSECDSDVGFDDSSDDSSDESVKGYDDMGMKARPQRDNTNCYKTNVGCPNCREIWQPDDLRHYVLFMAFGVKVFCTTCLFHFGPASAYHYCPLCKAKQVSPGGCGTDDVGGSGYDISMFDKQTTCNSCKKKYGYQSCSVSEATLSVIRERIIEEEATRKKKEERTRRAMQRSGDIQTSSEQVPMGTEQGKSVVKGAPNIDRKVLEYNVGQVMVTGQCPVCGKSIRNSKNAQTHVEKCMKSSPSKKVTSFIVEEKKRRAPLKKASSKTINKSKTTGNKRGRKDKSSSSEDDTEYSSSD